MQNSGTENNTKIDQMMKTDQYTNLPVHINPPHSLRQES